MTATQLRQLKLCTTWSGMLITVLGIVVSISQGGSWLGNGLALFGVLITCVGNVVSAKLENHHEAALAADKERIEELVYRLEYAEERLDDPDFQRVVHMEASRYADKHQDDGR